MIKGTEYLFLCLLAICIFFDKVFIHILYVFN